MSHNTGTYTGPTGPYSDYNDLLTEGRSVLAAAGAGDPSREARLLLCAASGLDGAGLISHYWDTPTAAVIEQYLSYLLRRTKKEPVQYIVGEWDFMGLSFIVDRDVLIPRPDTECLVENVLSSKPGVTEPLILDLCTGSGCIAVSLADIIPSSYIIATDISGHALRVAEANARRNRVDNRVLFLEGDLFLPVNNMASVYKSGTEEAPDMTGAPIDIVIKNNFLFDIICANPPYIPEDELSALPDDVRLYEPVAALDSGADGCAFHRRIAEGAQPWLKPGGLLAMEAGADQSPRIEAILTENGYVNIRTAPDINKIPRTVLANRPAGL